MKRIIIVLLSSLLFSLSVKAQDNVKKEAEKMGAALLKKDYGTFVNYTYPDVIRQMGGKQKMARSIAQQMEGMEKEGNKIISLSFSAPSAILKEGKELQCTISQTMEIKIPAGKISTTSSLIAISTDNGAHWYFVDAGDRDINAIRSSMPNVSSRLALPKPESPKFSKD